MARKWCWNARQVFLHSRLFSKKFYAKDQGSSLGVYTTQWLNEFHWSARGESAEDWLDEPRKHRERLPYPPIKLIFPTKKTVQQSKLGEQVGPYRSAIRLDTDGRNPTVGGRYHIL